MLTFLAFGHKSVFVNIDKLGAAATAGPSLIADNFDELTGAATAT